MKKRVVICLLFLMLAMFVLPASAQTMRHVYDQTNTFSAEEIASLEKEMQAIYQDLQVDTMIVTTNNSMGKEPDLYAADFYKQERSVPWPENRVIFAFCFDIGPRGRYGEAAHGSPKHVLTARGDDELYNLLAPYLPSRNYGPAMHDYVAYVRKAMTPRAPLTIATEYSMYALAVGVLVALITVFSMKSNMKTAKSKKSAANYVLANSLHLSNSNDIFLYETEHRVKIETPSSGSGSSGGRSFTSSGGSSYGGRSGSL